MVLTAGGRVNRRNLAQGASNGNGTDEGKYTVDFNKSTLVSDSAYTNWLRGIA